MPLFEFNLKPLQKVMPWRDQTNEYLHWFGLTDGCYHMNLGDVQLFRYSDEILHFWSKEFPDVDYINEPYMDYQVVRLYEDVLSILADVIQPVPDEVYSYITTLEEQKNWEKTISEIIEVSYEDNDKWDAYDNATEWLFYRRLLGLGGGPNIIIWRIKDTIHIRWDNESIKQDNIPVWAAKTGEYQMPVKRFILEVESFHNRLINEMQSRLEEIEKDNPLPHIKIDIPELLIEQEERTHFLDTALKRQPHVKNWSKVVASNQMLLKK